MNLDLNTVREGWDFEAKLAAGKDGQGAVPKDLWPSYSAMANASGGIVVLGARERSDGSLNFVGIANIDKVERELWNLITDPRKVSVNLLGQEDVERCELEGVTVLVLHIPRATRRQRPVYINNNPLTGTYLRGHEGDRQVSEAEVKRMLADADPERPLDAQVLPRFSIADLDPESLKAFRNTLRSHNASHPYLASDDVELLRKVGGIVRNRDSGEDELTRAGLLMFGREETLREHMPTFHLDYRELDEVAVLAGTRWIDRVVPDGTWSGNLFGFYLKVLPKLTAGLKVPFQLAQDLLRRGETPVHLALKEALVNALIHADYGGHGGVRVFRFGDRFEFINPGTLLIPPEQIRQGGKSECRNTSLQNMFRVAGIGEKAGSGFPQILYAWREQHWRAPMLEEQIEEGQTRLVLSTLDLFPEGVMQSLHQRFGQVLDALPHSGRLALATAASEGRVSNQRLRELTSDHPADLTTRLKELVDRQLLQPHGTGKGRWYTLTQDAGAEDVAPQSTPQSTPQSAPQSAPQSLAEQAEAFKGLKDISDSRWASKEVMDQVILDLCRGQALTIEEIAKAVKRSPRTIADHHLNALVKRGLMTWELAGESSRKRRYRTVLRSKDG